MKNNEQINDFFEILKSLHDSMIVKGGMPLTIDRLKKITAYELLSSLAPNGIRFNTIQTQIDVKHRNSNKCYYFLSNYFVSKEAALNLSMFEF